MGEHEQRFAEFRAKVRAVGEQWAENRPAGLTELLCAAAADDPELLELARAGAQLLEDFLDGLSCTAVLPPSGDLAADLIDGKALPHHVVGRLAPVYVVLVCEQRDARMQELDVPGVLRTTRSGLVVLLVPNRDTELLHEITARLAGTTRWIATARRPVAELPDAYAEAAEVLRLVAAGCRPAGTYALTDVLVEQAIAANPSVATRLAEIIRPVRENQVLWETLVALVHADFNRNQAARDLFVHRSTMDYRLQRIARITGWDPAGGHGAQLLRAALFADAVA
ncbi:PucR family transcriptional regulator [Lentzea flava]|uniref:PucR family transcriptional regulator n=1 Tax=Lentzea flava TaxID=103732 RepID=UPI00166FD8E3|nr:PucR family transcriptional regulator [Lentzea flava]